MEYEYLPEIAGVYLEDSYFLGVVSEGADLRFKFLFALTCDHEEYIVPKPGEQHCYREGSIMFEHPMIIEWRAGKPKILRDPDGTFDFGSVEIYCRRPDRLRVVTEWFETIFDTKRVTVALSDKTSA